MPQITGNEPAIGYGFGWDDKNGSCFEYSGLTIRQEFAARAMQSLIIAHNIHEYEKVAKHAIFMADALIKELNK